MKKRIFRAICIAVLLSMVMSPAGEITARASEASVYEGSAEFQGIWTDYAAEEYAKGDGTQELPYLITNASELALLAKRTNEGTEREKYYELASDIDLSGHFWNPIGNNDKSAVGVLIGYDNVFSGHFNGNSYTIRNINIQQIDGVNFYGLFGCCYGGTIENLNIEGLNISIDTKNYLSVGSIAGNVFSSGKVSKCVVSNASLNLRGGNTLTAGGIVGDLNYGEVENCFVEAKINCYGEQALFVGGAFGDISNETTVANCMANCQVVTEANGVVEGEMGEQGYSYCDFVGGFAGKAGRANDNVSIKDCFAIGTVSTSTQKDEANGGMFAGCCGIVYENSTYENLVTAVAVYNNGVKENYFAKSETSCFYPDHSSEDTVYEHNNLITVYDNEIKTYSYVNGNVIDAYYDLATTKGNDVLKKCDFSQDNWCMETNEIGLRLYKEQIINVGTENAQKQFTCVTCGDTYTEAFTENHTHTTVIDEAVAPTCILEGKTEGSHCSVCNKVIKEQEAIPALGHEFKDDICTRCGYKMSGQWIRSGSKWWYRYENGSYPQSKRCRIGNACYGFDSAGWMQTGWAKYDNNWYYFVESGEMRTGWVSVRGAWYYLALDGRMVIGWQKVGNAWYYLKSDGRMATGWQKVGGAWYYLKSDGQMATGWQKVGNAWYYLKSDGRMASNTWIGNYYVNGSGAWVKSR